MAKPAQSLLPISPQLYVFQFLSAHNKIIVFQLFSTESPFRNYKVKIAKTAEETYWLRNANFKCK